MTTVGFAIASSYHFNLGLTQYNYDQTLATDYELTERLEHPKPPQNVTIKRLLATAVILKWMVLEQEIREFYINVDPVQSSWVWLERNDTRLAPFQITGIEGVARQYTVHNLLPDTLYRVSMMTANRYGLSNCSDNIQFTTLAETKLATSSIHVEPVEIFLVLCILTSWAIAIAMFLRQWSTLRIMHSREPNYRDKKPHNLESVQVVNTASESVISLGYNKNMARTMEQRQKRFERMHTMPNLKLDESNPNEVAVNVTDRKEEEINRPRFNSLGSKKEILGHKYSLKSFNPANFLIPNITEKKKPAKLTRQLTLDTHNEELPEDKEGSVTTQTDFKDVPYVDFSHSKTDAPTICSPVTESDELSTCTSSV